MTNFILDPPNSLSIKKQKKLATFPVRVMQKILITNLPTTIPSTLLFRINERIQSILSADRTIKGSLVTRQGLVCDPCVDTCETHWNGKAIVI